MRAIVREYKKHPVIRSLAGDVTKNLRNKAWREEVRAVFEYVRSNIRYTQDINGVETLQTPVATIAVGYGDCDDMCTLLAALLEAIGHPTAFMAVGREAGEYEHVYVITKIGDNDDWISLDPTEDEVMGWQPPDMTVFMRIDN